LPLPYWLLLLNTSVFSEKEKCAIFLGIVIAHNRKTTQCAFAAATATFAVACLCGVGMGMLHVQKHTSSVFFPLVYLIYKAAKEWVGE